MQPKAPPNEPNVAEIGYWHALSVAEVIAALDSSEGTGLSETEAARRLAALGPNSLPERGSASLAVVFLRQFQSPLIYLLFVAAGIAVFLGETGDASVILAVVLANAIIGTFQEGRASRSMAALRNISTIQSRVLRSGKEQVVDAKTLVRGDILLLAAGDAIPADARLIDATTVNVAEAVLTGESVPSSKSPSILPRETALAERSNFLFAGTHLTTGHARAIVVATGAQAEVGKILAFTESSVEPKTPLELRIAQFGKYVVVLGIAIFVTMMVLGLLRGIAWSEMLMVAIGQLVSIVPEGLPVAVTIALAVGMQRMARRKAIVRRLAAVESLGSTTVICTDKTGTLTRNEMTVTQIVLADGRTIEVSGSGYAPRGELLDQGRTATLATDGNLRALLEGVVLCNDAELCPPDRGQTEWRPVGDPTEVALLTLAHKGGLNLSDLRQAEPRLDELAFDAAHRMMATRHPSRIVFKGAPESILKLCQHAQESGRAAAFTAERRAAALSAAEEMASRALRVLAVAVIEGELSPLADAPEFSAFEGRATFLGLVGQMDPPRDEAKSAIRRAKEAGIRTVMITGDHKSTGLAIARSLGIATDDDTAVDDRELHGMTDEELARRVPQIRVFARVEPLQKLRIVDALRRLGEVVAMTGDGVNDAPALARADIGVAMGIAGTEVAKQASDIVITDDNFSTIVDAIEEGRVIYRNLKKVILLLLATGAAEVGVLLLAVLLGYPLPFAAVQLLWINVVAEGTITVNLILDPPEGNEMRFPPIPHGEPLVDRRLLKRLLLMAFTMASATLGFFVVRTNMGVPFAQAQTATFTLLAVCVWFNVLNCRSEIRSALGSNLLKNRWLFAGLLLSNALQALVVFVPALNRIFHTVPLPWSEVVTIGLVGSLVLWVEEIRKYFARRSLATLLAPDAPRTSADAASAR